jgi:hypothetical protein
MVPAVVVVGPQRRAQNSPTGPYGAGPAVGCSFGAMSKKPEPPSPIKIGFAGLEEILRRAHAKRFEFRLISPSPVEGRAVIDITAPDGVTKRYAFPAEDIDRVAELLATLDVEVPDLRGGS